MGIGADVQTRGRMSGRLSDLSQLRQPKRANSAPAPVKHDALAMRHEALALYERAEKEARYDKAAQEVRVSPMDPIAKGWIELAVKGAKKLWVRQTPERHLNHLFLMLAANDTKGLATVFSAPKLDANGKPEFCEDGTPKVDNLIRSFTTGLAIGKKMANSKAPLPPLVRERLSQLNDFFSTSEGKKLTGLGDLGTTTYQRPDVKDAPQLPKAFAQANTLLDALSDELLIHTHLEANPQVTASHAYALSEFGALLRSNPDDYVRKETIIEEGVERETIVEDKSGYRRPGLSELQDEILKSGQPASQNRHVQALSWKLTQQTRRDFLAAMDTLVGGSTASPSSHDANRVRAGSDDLRGSA